MSLRFMREFLRSPASVGAIWPSSPSLAKMMVHVSQLHQADFVLELGAGTGAFTGKILENLQPKARFVALEKNAELASKISLKFPQAGVIVGCATRLRYYLQEKNLGRPQAILSGLPWAAFNFSLQIQILSEIAHALPPGGIFATFAYYGPHWLTAGRTFRKRLDEIFNNVRRTRVVLVNLPPAFVYYCQK